MLQRTLDTVAQDQSELINSLFSLYVLFSHCSQYDVTLENCLLQILSLSLAYKHHSTRWKNKTYKLKPSHNWLSNQREGSYKCRVRLDKKIFQLPQNWFAWGTNMAAVSLFWNTNMAPVTSCEKTLYCFNNSLTFVNLLK